MVLELHFHKVFISILLIEIEAFKLQSFADPANDVLALSTALVVKFHNTTKINALCTPLSIMLMNVLLNIILFYFRRNISRHHRVDGPRKVQNFYSSFWKMLRAMLSTRWEQNTGPKKSYSFKHYIWFHIGESLVNVINKSQSFLYILEWSCIWMLQTKCCRPIKTKLDVMEAWLYC